MSDSVLKKPRARSLSLRLKRFEPGFAAAPTTRMKQTTLDCKHLAFTHVLQPASKLQFQLHLLGISPKKSSTCWALIRNVSCPFKVYELPNLGEI